uniref:cell surface glycoprotein CD200 receptor 1-A isoform X2 n=1 Tax=Semicossyphus pulcher TaxID=241346 RepID=UPI0037E731BB
MWIYAAVFLLLSGAWSDDQESRILYFNNGNDVNLTCGNKTWKETIYVIWNITFKDCRISLDDKGQSRDSCEDGKSLQNTSNFQPYLHIPNFSHADEGIYKCESPYTGGAKNVLIKVITTVSPNLSMWVEPNGNETVAFCKAERGKPAANISWNRAENSSSEETRESNGFFTVESRLVLPEGTDTEGLRCLVRHPCWEGEKTVGRQEHRKGNVPWLCFLIVVVITLLLAGFLFIALKKLRPLWQCQQSDPSSSKSPPMEDVEEVEPYASYVQRVNSIYNSSADLFT